MDRFKINDKIIIVGKNIKGKVVFVGETHFADEILYGIAMDDPIGRHDGTMNGVRYFKCKENHGIFVKASQLKIEDSISERSGGCKVPSPKKSSSLESKLQKKKSSTKIGNAENSSTTGNGFKKCDGIQPNSKEIFKRKSKEIVKSEENLYPIERKCETISNDGNFSKAIENGCMKLEEENYLQANELNYKTGQLATLQTELSRLKSCILWSRKFSDSNNMKDINLKMFFSREIDVRIKNMEDTIGNLDVEKPKAHFKEYTDLKEQNRYLKNYVTDLEKENEFLMSTMLRIKGIVSNQKKRRQDQKGRTQAYLQKQVGRFFKDNAVSSRLFTEDEGTVWNEATPNSFRRDLESLSMASGKGISPQDESILDNSIYKKEKEDNKEKSIKDNLEPDSFNIPVPSSVEAKISKRLPARSYRYKPYPRNLLCKREKMPPCSSENPLKCIQKEFGKLSLEMSKELLGSKQNCETSSPLSAKGPKKRDFLNRLGGVNNSGKELTKQKSSIDQTKGRKSVIRRNPMKKKSVYSSSRKLC